MGRLNRISVIIVVGIVAIGFAAASSQNKAAAQNVRERLLQQQQQLQKKRIIEQQKKLQSSRKLEAPAPGPLTDDTAKNKDKFKEASVIYRNLRKAQHLSHEAAIATLKNSGFPTDEIVPIP